MKNNLRQYYDLDKDVQYQEKDRIRENQRAGKFVETTIAWIPKIYLLGSWYKPPRNEKGMRSHVTMQHNMKKR